MEFRLLGPVELWSRNQQIDLGTAKIRLLLAVLLLEAGRAVPFELLVTRVWGEEPPAKVASSVQANLSRLRRKLEQAGDDRVQLEHLAATGYRLRVAAEDVDALEFTRTVIQGQAAASRGERERAIRLLQTAEAMIRGDPLTGLPGEWASSARAALRERLRAATVTRLRLQLERDDPQLLLAELRELSGRYPLDQSVAGLLMRALHAAGRSADALGVFQAARRRLRERLGIDPNHALREIHRQILHGEETAPERSGEVATSSTATRELNALEQNPSVFVGRRRNLEAIRHEIDAALAADQSALCVIDGMPGVGKTTLALRLAHELRSRCPDGAMQVHLRSHDPTQPPTSAEAALRLLLSMLGAETRELQRAVNLDQALVLWRRYTQGRRLLLLLDDAGDAEQVKPLVPSDPGNIVLVTCRRQLAELPGAIRHTLPLMGDDDARALFTAAAATARENETGSENDSEAMTAIVQACGRLPLALSIAGALFRTRSSWTPGDFADRLTRTLATQGVDSLSERLDATFETSYRDLPELPRRILRRVALHPGSRVRPYFAAALADAEPFATELALDTLVGHHLLTERQRGHYQVHDLVKGFAHRRMAGDEVPDDIRAARDRLMTVAIAAVDRAAALFHPYRHVNLSGISDAAAPLPPLTTARDAGAWLDAEHEALQALILEAYGDERSRHAAALAHMLATYLDRRSLWRESVPIHEKALHTWARLENAVGQAHALGDLATAFWRLGKLDQAHYCSETALAIWDRLGDTDGKADAILQLGRAHLSAHRLDEAIRCYRQTASLRATRNDEQGEGQALYHLGVALFEAGHYAEGIADTRRALKLARGAHDEVVERNCLNNLGEFHRKRGEYEQALDCYRQAMVLATRVGDPRNIAVAALNLGEIHGLTRHPREALEFLDQAFDTFTRQGTSRSIVNTLLAMIRVHIQLNETERAAALLEQATATATAIAGPTADPVVAAHVHLTGGALYEHRREYPAALAEYRSALARARRAHAILEEAAAHQGIGDVLAVGPRPATARSHWRKALEIYAPLEAQKANELRRLLGEDALPP